MAKRRVVSRERFVDPSKVGTRRPAGSSGGRVRQTVSSATDSAKRTVRRVVGHVSRSRGLKEASWDCTHCPTKGIPGFTKRCPNCGSPKEVGEEYYADPSRPLATQEELQRAGVTAEHASDELCEFCGARLRPGSSKCPNCGAEIDPEAADRAHAHLATVPRRSNTHSGSYIQQRRQQTTFPFSLSQIPGDVQYWAIGIAVALVAIIGLFILFRPHVAEMSVSGLSWSRTIPREEHQYNQHEGWSLPSGADLVSQEERFHHNEQVLDHYEDVQVEKSREVLDGYDTDCQNVEVFSHYDEVYDYSETVTYDDGSSETIDHYSQEAVYTTERQCEEVPRYRTEYYLSLKHI